MILIAFFAYRANVLFKIEDVKARKVLDPTIASYTLNYVIQKSNNETNVKIKTKRFWALYVNSYFDFKSFGNEINHYLDDSLYYDLERDRNKQTNVFVQKNMMKLQDDWVQYGQSQQKQFFQIQKAVITEDDNAFDNSLYIRVFFRMDKNYDVYERQIYSIGQLFGEVGGLKTTLFLVFSYIMSMYSSQLAQVLISSKIFQVTDKKNKKKSSKNDSLTKESSDQLGKELFSNDAEEISNNILTRKRFQFQSRKYCIKFFRYFKSIDKNGTSKLQRNYQQFEVAQTILRQELDVVNLIRRLRAVQFIMQSYLSPIERLSIIYNSQNVLNPKDSNLSQSDFNDFNEQNLIKILEKKENFKLNKRILKRKITDYLYDQDSNDKEKSNGAKGLLSSIIKTPKDYILRDIINGKHINKKSSSSGSKSTNTRVQSTRPHKEDSSCLMLKVQDLGFKSNSSKDKKRKSKFKIENASSSSKIKDQFDDIEDSQRHALKGQVVTYRSVKSYKKRKVEPFEI
ncbi:UNKNOWN [Stylonychia lemnae]|uniref:Uncharacterized protein n=1 Tax=Stylonychia lemnae TaxID=5949 RepID=A0A077ZYB8_STYLE|nr:UNKNOWN [Stylonychia lemnae]|eukprot:CDW74840.1 UNKNOWN [Stylonychia lemnae]